MRHIIAVVIGWMLLTGQPVGAAEPIFKNVFKPKAGTTARDAKKVKGQLSHLQIVDLSVEKRDGRWVWMAKVKSLGRRFQKNQLQVTAVQLDGPVKLGPAGNAIRYGKVFEKNATRQFTRQDWSKVNRASHLRVEILDTRTRKKVSKTVAFPGSPVAAAAAGATRQAAQPGPGAAQAVEETFAVETAAYKGRGDFVLRIRNTGNVAISAGQLEIRPLYHVDTRPVIMGAVLHNRGPIPVGGIRPIYGSGTDGLYFNNMAECGRLKRLEFLIRNPRSGQFLSHRLTVPMPTYKITGIDMYNSQLSYRVVNEAPYRATYNVRMLTISLYEAEYQHGYGKKRCTLKDTFHGRITLDANKGDTLYIPPERVNADIKKQCPNLKEGFYNVQGLQAEAYAESASDVCTSKGPGCPISQISIYSFSQIGEDILYSP